MNISTLRSRLLRLRKFVGTENFGGVEHIRCSSMAEFYKKVKEYEKGLIIPETPSIEEWEKMANEHKRKLNVET